MTVTNWLGVALLATIAAAAFGITAHTNGFWETALMWGGSTAISAAVVFAVMLIAR